MVTWFPAFAGMRVACASGSAQPPGSIRTQGFGSAQPPGSIQNYYKNPVVIIILTDIEIQNILIHAYKTTYNLVASGFSKNSSYIGA